MLCHTFCHLHGVGPKTEHKLWRAGIRTWDDLLATERPPMPPVARALAGARLQESAHALENGNAEFFAQLLPASEQWRLFSDFRDQLAYFDIETTGLDHDRDHITTIALYNGRKVTTYVHGRDLMRFATDVARCKVLVSYNGRSFDAPFVERELGIELPSAHIDLRHVLRSLRISGGLKRCEATLGIERDPRLTGVDGADAVLFWQAFEESREARYLETLLAYNAADAIGLEPLLAHAFNRKVAKTPFADQLAVEVPRLADNPHRPDPSCLQGL